ncbi:hypothetical protein BT63DRAFT_458446 [Microthyrium microscopicum]|uniref:Uncharacterized protein n=1 Tax=Microthyrium microscopicum TaxID=703497 RepID=A0A6A6U3B3_9PEZI|nr:hypothetical protein BT63DRAFT_458446 [Microthyrium microscopicum]
MPSLRRFSLARLLGRAKNGTDDNLPPRSLSSMTMRHSSPIEAERRPGSSMSFQSTAHHLSSSFNYKAEARREDHQSLSHFVLWYLFYDLIQRPASATSCYSELSRPQLRGWVRIGHELNNCPSSMMPPIALPGLHCACEDLGIDFEVMKLRLSRFARMEASSELVGLSSLPVRFFESARLKLQSDRNIVECCRPTPGTQWYGYRYQLLTDIDAYLQLVNVHIFSSHQGALESLGHYSPRVSARWSDILHYAIHPPSNFYQESFDIDQEVKAYQSSCLSLERYGYRGAGIFGYDGQRTSSTPGAVSEGCAQTNFHTALMRRLVQLQFGALNQYAGHQEEDLPLPPFSKSPTPQDLISTYQRPVTPLRRKGTARVFPKVQFSDYGQSSNQHQPQPPIYQSPILSETSPLHLSTLSEDTVDHSRSATPPECYRSPVSPEADYSTIVASNMQELHNHSSSQGGHHQVQELHELEA